MLRCGGNGLRYILYMTDCLDCITGVSSSVTWSIYVVLGKYREKKERDRN